MLRTGFALLLVMAAWSGGANAFTAHCRLHVDGKTYLNEACPITLNADGGFVIGVDNGKPGKYFAYVTVDRNSGTGEGWWNGQENAPKAQTALGVLTQQGRCWINARVKVCASR